MINLQRAIAITRCFAFEQIEIDLITMVAEALSRHPGMRLDLRDEDTAFAALFATARPPNPGFNLRLEYILQWIVERREEIIETVTRPMPFTVNWRNGQGLLVSLSARALVEAHCAAGVGEWTVSQEYLDGIMLCSGYARHAVRAETVGMEWRKVTGERRARWHAVA